MKQQRVISDPRLEVRCGLQQSPGGGIRPPEQLEEGTSRQRGTIFEGKAPFVFVYDHYRVSDTDGAILESQDPPP